MSKNNGGSAFPSTESNYHNENMRSDGMSLRDYFAAKASTAIDPPKDYVDLANSKLARDAWARRCYQMADSMLAARDK